MIGLKNSYFPLIHLPSCYRTVCYWTACYRVVCYQTVQQTNHIQSCSLNQPIATLVSITIETVYKLLNLCILCQFFKGKISLCHITWLLFFSLKLQFLWLIGNRTSCRPIRSIIILVVNKSNSRCAVVRFCYHSYDYRPNWTPLSPITITYWLQT